MVTLSPIYMMPIMGFPMSDPLVVFTPSTPVFPPALSAGLLSLQKLSLLSKSISQISQINPFYLQAHQYPWGQYQGGTEASALELEFTGGLSRPAWALCPGLWSSGSSTHAQVRSHLPRKRFLMNDPLWSSRTSVIRSCPRFRQQFS